jgi:peptide/nickel transport system substrate-binding protein
MSRLRVVVAAVIGATFALGVLGGATASLSKYGGVLVVRLGGDPDSLDPTVSRTPWASNIQGTMCLRLYEFASNHGKLELDPILAAAQPLISADKLSYTVELRKGIEFNDGTPFTAQSVVASYQRYLTYPGSAQASNFADVAGVKATGPYTVVYNLKQADSTFTGNMYPLSPTAIAAEGANFSTDPICVGPFMVDHWDPNVDVTLVKSPYYYKRGAIFLDKIVFKEIVDPSAALADLEAGDIQVLNGVPPAEVQAVKQDSSLRLIEAPQVGYHGIALNIGDKNGLGNLPYANVGTPLASSPKLRMAFEEAINRQLLNKVVFGGLYQPTCEFIPAANSEWYPAISVPCTPYDPDAARKLVAESGYTNPTVRLLIPTSMVDLDWAQFIQAEEAAVGINVVIDEESSATFTALEVSGKFDAESSAENAADPDPNSLIYNRVATAGDHNYGGYSNPRLDYTLNQALKATSFKARAVYYRLAQQIIHDDRPFIFLYNPTTLLAYSTSLKGIEVTPFGAAILVNAQYR